MECIARGAARRGLSAALIGIATLCAGAPAHAGAFTTYGSSVRQFSLPLADPAQPFGVRVDALPDGRLIAATGSQVFIETGLRTGQFAPAATIDSTLTDGLDPAFVSVSPNGSRVAIGGGVGRPVLVFDPSDLSDGVLDATDTRAFGVDNFDGAWADEDRLAIAAGDFVDPAFVSLLDVRSDPLAPANPIIVDNIQGASGGVAFDDQGNLFTGNGFAFGTGSDTGALKAFSPSEWMGGANFETGGTFVGDFLSAAGLSFDDAGNLFVGGGDFSEGDAGTLAIIRSSALTQSLSGGGPIPSFAPMDVRRLDPLGDASGFFASVFNEATGELLIVNGDDVFATVPSPSGVGVAALCAFGVLRRRRVRSEPCS